MGLGLLHSRVVVGEHHARVVGPRVQARRRPRQPGRLLVGTPMMLRSAVRRIRTGTGQPPRRSGPDAAWRRYLTDVEPLLRRELRLHRFARAPLLGPANTKPRPV